MKVFISFTIIMTLFFVLSISTPFLYAQLNTKGLKQLVKDSDLIVVGKIVALSSHWNENKSRIFTRIDLTVNEKLKGEAANKISFENPGGEIDGVGELYSHTAKFVRDESVVLFLKRDKKGNLQINNGSEGKYLISEESSESKNIIQNVKLKNLKEQIRKIQKE